MYKENEFEWDSIEPAHEEITELHVTAGDQALSFDVSYRGCGDKVSYTLQANARTGYGSRYVVKATKAQPTATSIKLAYLTHRKGLRGSTTAVVNVQAEKTHTLVDPYVSGSSRRKDCTCSAQLPPRGNQTIKLAVLGSHQLWVLPEDDGGTPLLLFAWHDATGRPDKILESTGLPKSCKSEKLVIDEVPNIACTCPDEEQPVRQKTEGAGATLPEWEVTRRNDVILQRDDSSCKVYDTKEGEYWVFFAHNSSTAISLADDPVDGCKNTFRTEFVKISDTGTPYAAIAGGRKLAIKGGHSAIVLDGPALGGSRLFEIAPSKVEGSEASWCLTYSRPAHYRLLVVPMWGGVSVAPEWHGLRQSDGRSVASEVLDKPVLLDGEDTIKVLSGACRVFALHESLRPKGEERTSGMDADVCGNGILWYPALHDCTFQLNRAKQDIALRQALCVGIPADVAPDETSVAVYCLGNWGTVIHACGGDVYYSMDVGLDADGGLNHADGVIPAGDRRLVRVKSFTALALYGPHVTSPFSGDLEPTKTCPEITPDLDIAYDSRSGTASVCVDGKRVKMPKGYRRSKEHSIRFAAREILFREECTGNKAREQEAKEPPCPEVEPHDGLQGYYKVMFDFYPDPTPGIPTLPSQAMHCYVLVRDNEGGARLHDTSVVSEAVDLFNVWTTCARFAVSGVSLVTDTDRMCGERVRLCNENGDSLFHCVQFKDVVWMKNGKPIDSQDTLDVLVPKTGPSLTIDSREAGYVIGKAVLQAEKDNGAELYYRNAYFTC